MLLSRLITNLAADLRAHRCLHEDQRQFHPPSVQHLRQCRYQRPQPVIGPIMGPVSAPKVPPPFTSTGSGATHLRQRRIQGQGLGSEISLTTSVTTSVSTGLSGSSHSSVDAKQSLVPECAPIPVLWYLLPPVNLYSYILSLGSRRINQSPSPSPRTVPQRRSPSSPGPSPLA